mgnify:CR=1 FL=1
MKKISFILILALTLVSFVSCNDDDGGPSIAYQLAEITGETLPDFFRILMLGGSLGRCDSIVIPC